MISWRQIMIRTQVQIQEDQINWLRSKARDRGVSISQLIREGIDLYRFQEDRLPKEKKRKALAAVGRFASGRSDISDRHDEYLSGAYRGNES
jgi:post-segregation antitoxin (ccd killing protein)